MSRRVEVRATVLGLIQRAASERLRPGNIYYIVSSTWWASICDSLDIQQDLRQPPVVESAMPFVTGELTGDLGKPARSVQMNERPNTSLQPHKSVEKKDCDISEPDDWIAGVYTSTRTRGMTQDESSPVVVLRPGLILGVDIVAVPAYLYGYLLDEVAKTEEFSINVTSPRFHIPRYICAWGLGREPKLDLYPRLVAIAVPRRTVIRPEEEAQPEPETATDTDSTPFLVQCRGDLCVSRQLQRSQSPIEVLGAALLCDSEPLLAQLKAATIARLREVDSSDVYQVKDDTTCRIWILNRDHLHIMDTCSGTSEIPPASHGFEVLSRSQLALPLVSLFRKLKLTTRHVNHNTLHPIPPHQLPCHAPVFLVDPEIIADTSNGLLQDVEAPLVPRFAFEAAGGSRSFLLPQLLPSSQAHCSQRTGSYHLGAWCLCRQCRSEPWRNFQLGDRLDVCFRSTGKWEEGFVVEVIDYDALVAMANGSGKEDRPELEAILEHITLTLTNDPCSFKPRAVRISSSNSLISQVFDAHSTNLAYLGRYSYENYQCVSSSPPVLRCPGEIQYWRDDFCAHLCASNETRGLNRVPGRAESIISDMLYVPTDPILYDPIALRSTKSESPSDSDALTIFAELSAFEGTVPPCAGRVGFRNLGNTCYLNSTLQCLLQLPEFVEYYAMGLGQLEVSYMSKFGTRGQITEAITELIREAWFSDITQLQYSPAFIAALTRRETANLKGMVLVSRFSSTDLISLALYADFAGSWHESSTFVRLLIPQRLKLELDRMHPSFRGIQQQDASELLAFLLDGLHEDGNVAGSQNMPASFRIAYGPLLRFCLCETCSFAELQSTPHEPLCSNGTFLGDIHDSDPNLCSVPVVRTCHDRINEGTLEGSTTPSSPHELKELYKHPIASTMNPTYLRDLESSIVSDLNASQRAWEGYLTRHDSAIVRLCHAQLQSTLTCTTCAASQNSYDPYVMVSLPIPRQKFDDAASQTLDVIYLGSAVGTAIHGYCELDYTTQLTDLRTSLISTLKQVRELEVVPEELVCAVVRGRKLVTVLQSRYASPVYIMDYALAGDLLIVWHVPSSISQLKSSMTPCTAPASKPLRPGIPSASTSSSQQHLLVVRHWCDGSPVLLPTLACLRAFQVPSELGDTPSTPSLVVRLHDLMRGVATSLLALVKESELEADYARVTRGRMKGSKASVEEMLETIISLYCRVFITSADGDAILFEVPTTKSDASHISNHPTTNTYDSAVLDLSRLSEAADTSGEKLNLAISLAWESLDHGEKDADVTRPYGHIESSATGVAKFALSMIGRLQEEIFFCRSNRMLSARNDDSAVDSNSHGGQVRCLFNAPPSTINTVIRAVGTELPTDVSLGECFDTFSEVELLGQDSNSWVCSSCKAPRNAIKRMQFWSAPQILIVQLKRFASNYHSRRKNTILVKFDRRLDLGPYMANFAKQPRAVYELCGVAQHKGSLSFGHYTAVVQRISFKSMAERQAQTDPNNEQNADEAQLWLYSSDDMVSSLEPSQLSNTLITDAAYVLFYRKVPL